MSERLWIGEGNPKAVATGPNKGRWRLQWAIIERGSTKPKKIDRLFDTKTAAVSWREETKRRLQQGAVGLGKGGITLGEWFGELAGTEANERRDGHWSRDGATASTIYTKSCRWNKWVSASDLALTPMRMIDRNRARDFLAELKGNGATIATCREVVGMLAKVFADALKERPELSSLRNPFAALPIQSDEERATEEALAAERPETEILLGTRQARVALARLADPRQRALLAVALYGGLRTSEIMVLSRSRIDTAAGVMLIDRAVKIGERGVQSIGLPKGRKKRIACVCPALGKILEAAFVTDRDLIFGAATKDEPKMKKRFYEEWARTLEAAGLPADLDVQDCRATHNNWIEKLMPNVSLSTRLEHMGHSLTGSGNGPKGIVVNLRNYTGYIPEGYKALRSGLEEIIVPRSARRLVRRDKGVPRLKKAA